MYKILSINPGSTSTKIAVYEDETVIFVKNIVHEASELSAFDTLLDQFELRKECVLEALKENGVTPSELSAVVGRGGLLPPVKGGGYLVNQDMLNEVRFGKARPHASNLGAVIAHSIAEQLHIPAYIYDAVATDELRDVARLTGVPEVMRQSFCHALNSKATARKVASDMGGTYNNMNFVVAHIGGGISISAHEKGKISDIVSDDEGPFSPERAGTMPLGNIIDICYNGGMTQKSLNSKLKGASGLQGHIGTNDGRVVEKMIADGDFSAKLVYDSMAYQIAKSIGAMAASLCGKVDAVILTGGLAYSKYLTYEISKYVSFVSKVVVVAGENEMESLSLGALRLLRGEETASDYVFVGK